MKIFKNINILYLFILTTITLNCQEVSNNHSKLSTQLPYNSDNLKIYYRFDSMTGVHLVSNNLKPQKFSKKELLQKVKESDGFAKGKIYYPLISFYKDSILYKGIIYEGYADNDMNTFIFQLTSYDKNKNIIDAILLDHRFIFEIYYWNDFQIDKDGKIIIIKNSQQLYDFSEEPPNVQGQIQSEKITYQISSEGKFELINEK